MADMSARPIALFDSGVGGLTVFAAVRALLPGESLLYLGDTARVPYGIKSHATILRYTEKACARLLEYGAKMLVIACNTATAAALPTLRDKFAPVPVMGVVEPGAQAAVRASRNGRIAIIATEATIRGGAYQKAIVEICPAARTISRACTLFVSLAEEGWGDGPIAESVAAKYLGDIFGGGGRLESLPDTLLLGCTHFPLLKKAIAKNIHADVAIVDSARATALAVRRHLRQKRMLGNGKAEERFLTTDNPERFARAGSLFLERSLRESDIELVDL